MSLPFDLFAHLPVELVSYSISHHCLPRAWSTMKQHHHPSSIRDGIIQTSRLTTLFVVFEVADAVQDEVFLLLGKNHLLFRIQSSSHQSVLLRIFAIDSPFQA